MSLKTCRYCNNKYEDSWGMWVSKYCCKNCYHNKKRLYNVGDVIYTNDNQKQPNKTLNAIVATGEIVNIYEINRPTQNGLCQYAIKLSNGKIVYRFEHQLFTNLEDCSLFVETTNKRREIMRSANSLLKEI